MAAVREAYQQMVLFHGENIEDTEDEVDDEEDDYNEDDYDDEIDDSDS